MQGLPRAGNNILAGLLMGLTNAGQGYVEGQELAQQRARQKQQDDLAAKRDARDEATFNQQQADAAQKAKLAPFQADADTLGGILSNYPNHDPSLDLLKGQMGQGQARFAQPGESDSPGAAPSTLQFIHPQPATADPDASLLGAVRSKMGLKPGPNVFGPAPTLSVPPVQLPGSPRVVSLDSLNGDLGDTKSDISSGLAREKMDAAASLKDASNASALQRALIRASTAQNAALAGLARAALPGVTKLIQDGGSPERVVQFYQSLAPQLRDSLGLQSPGAAMPDASQPAPSQGAPSPAPVQPADTRPGNGPKVSVWGDLQAPPLYAGDRLQPGTQPATRPSLSLLRPASPAGPVGMVPSAPVEPAGTGTNLTHEDLFPQGSVADARVDFFNAHGKFYNAEADKLNEEVSEMRTLLPMKVDQARAQVGLLNARTHQTDALRDAAFWNVYLRQQRLSLDERHEASGEYFKSLNYELAVQQEKLKEVETQFNMAQKAQQFVPYGVRARVNAAQTRIKSLGSELASLEVAHADPNSKLDEASQNRVLLQIQQTRSELDRTLGELGLPVGNDAPNSILNRPTPMGGDAQAPVAPTPGAVPAFQPRNPAADLQRMGQPAPPAQPNPATFGHPAAFTGTAVPAPGQFYAHPTLGQIERPARFQYSTQQQREAAFKTWQADHPGQRMDPGTMIYLSAIAEHVARQAAMGGAGR